jgi:hypothetical protein
MGVKWEQQPLLPMAVMMMGISSMMMPHASLTFVHASLTFVCRVVMETLLTALTP